MLDWLQRQAGKSWEILQIWIPNKCMASVHHIASTLGREYMYGDKDGIVIDSSARKAVKLEDGQEQEAQGTKWSMDSIGTDNAVISSGNRQPRSFRNLTTVSRPCAFAWYNWHKSQLLSSPYTAR